ncbi:MAG: glucosyltransferase domain-containing protein, partial [Lachnospiraceae bacterium]|nr:glucosyltransferase domain-containing protein [Lachnospiraceae bacterium]
MKTPTEVVQNLNKYIKKEWKLAFLAAFVCGLLVHMPMLLSDIPNHDGLDSMYFDQNMITSGRWFLMVACGLTSYYTLPWLIGVLGMLWLAVTAVLLVEFLEVKDRCCIVLISGLLVSFPALSSTFAYVFTMDGYLLGLMLAVAAVLCVKKLRYGFLPGAICLAFSLGTYQAYLPFAVILSIYGILVFVMERAGERAQ